MGKIEDLVCELSENLRVEGPYSERNLIENILCRVGREIDGKFSGDIAGSKTEIIAMDIATDTDYTPSVLRFGGESPLADGEEYTGVVIDKNGCAKVHVYIPVYRTRDYVEISIASSNDPYREHGFTYNYTQNEDIISRLKKAFGGNVVNLTILQDGNVVANIFHMYIDDFADRYIYMDLELAVAET